MKNVFVVLVLLVSSMVYCDTLSESNLTSEQINKTKLYIAQLKVQEPEASGQEKVKEISEWVNIGTEIGRGLAGCAKELGVEVNNFVKTPVGKLASVVIVWKLCGRDIMHFGFGLFFFLLGIPLWVYFFRRMCVIKSVEYGEKKYFWGKSSKTIAYYKQGENNETRWAMFLALCVILGISLIIMFA